VKDGVDEIEVEIAPNVRVNVLRQTISDTFKSAGAADAKAEPAKG
jgi:preprotein translocase subunit YajC